MPNCETLDQRREKMNGEGSRLEKIAITGRDEIMNGEEDGTNNYLRRGTVELGEETGGSFWLVGQVYGPTTTVMA